MIIRLKVECVRGFYLKEQCIRVIEMEEDTTLLDLHEIIQEVVGFDRDHPFDFYLANSSSPWAHKKWLGESESEDWADRESEFLHIRLSQVFPLGRKKLYYLFDFGDKWTFEIRKTRGSKKPEVDVAYPRVIESIGPIPEQYPRWE